MTRARTGLTRATVSAIVAMAATAAVTAAEASVVRTLSPEQLAAGAERVVVGEVRELASRWSVDGTRVETVVTVATDDGDAITIVQPGGVVGGVQQIILGMPSYRVGERARFFVRHNRDGASWRVYGWSQGKWPELVVAGAPIYLPGRRPDTAAFATNGMVWPAAGMPVPYLLNNAGSDDLAAADVASAVAAAFATWQDVPCAAITYAFAGMTDLQVAVDGENVILFVETGWIYGSEAAGATALTIADGAQTADVAMNGENFHWAIGPAGALVASDTFDLQGVLTHELGHFSGLGHTMSAHDTMYYSWTPWRNQRTPSLDDKLGLCAIYPTAGDECSGASTGCAAGDTCTTTGSGRLCEHPADVIGASCNYDRVECADFCLFTAADLSTGYCSRFCDTNADCPLTHHCDVASAGTTAVKVCFAGAQPPPVDAAPGCASDEACPGGEYCTSMGTCNLDCRTATDCGPTSICDPHGRCLPSDGNDAGGCCGTSRDGRGSATASAFLLLAFCIRRRRRAHL